MIWYIESVTPYPSLCNKMLRVPFFGASNTNFWSESHHPRVSRMQKCDAGLIKRSRKSFAYIYR